MSSRNAPGYTRPLGSARKLLLLPLITSTYFMVSGGPYGIEDILGGAGYGSALLILLLLPVFWSLPTALMIGELAAALPEAGGFYVWVRRALGPFWGFQEAWLSLTASIFDMAIYPTLFVLYLARLAPAWTTGSRGVLWSLLVVVVCCLWNLRGAPAVGDASVGLFALLLSPFAVLVAAGFWRGLHTHAAIPPVHHELSMSTAILVAMWNYMGWDNASTVAEEVENPQRNYPRAMLMSTALVAISYVLPLAAIAAAGISVDQFTTGSWADAASDLIGPALALAIVAGGMISGFGMFNALVMSYTRLPQAMAEDGLLPRAFAKKNSRGVPWVSLLVCGVGWACALGFTFERLISIDLMLYGSSLILEFVALIALRIREPALARPFSAGSLPVVCALSISPAALIFYAMYAARAEQLAHMPALLFALLIACGGPLGYWITSIAEKWRREPNAPLSL